MYTYVQVLRNAHVYMHVKARCQPQVPNLRSCPSCLLVVFGSFDWVLVLFRFVLDTEPEVLRLGLGWLAISTQRILQCWNYKLMIPGFSCGCRKLCQLMFHCCDKTPRPWQLTERRLYFHSWFQRDKSHHHHHGKTCSRQAWGLEQQAEGSHLKHKYAAERVHSKQVSA